VLSLFYFSCYHISNYSQASDSRRKSTHPSTYFLLRDQVLASYRSLNGRRDILSLGHFSSSNPLHPLVKSFSSGPMLSLTTKSTEDSSELFEYTSERWMFVGALFFKADAHH
jgi:hypothetical protein